MPQAGPDSHRVHFAAVAAFAMAVLAGAAAAAAPADSTAAVAQSAVQRPAAEVRLVDAKENESATGGDRSQPSVIIAPPADAASAPADKPATKKAPAKKAPANKAPAEKQPAKKAPAKKQPAKKAPAKKQPAKKAPAKKAPTATAAPQSGKDCDYCYGCNSLSHACRRQWVCGKRYFDRLAAGLCRR